MDVISRADTALLPSYPMSVSPRRRNLRGLARRHVLTIAGCALVVFGAAAYFTSRMVPVYSSAATVRIYGKQPDAPAQDLLFLSRANEVRTEMEILHSRALAGAVVDSLALQLQIDYPRRVLRRELLGHVVVAPRRVLRTELLGRVEVRRDAAAHRYELVRRARGVFLMRDAGTTDSLGTLPVGVRTAIQGITLELSPAATRFPLLGIEVMPFDVAVDSLLGALSVSRRDRDTDIIEVRFESSDPDLAWQVPNALVRQFIAWRQDARQAETRSTLDFLRAQIDRLGQQLAADEDSLRRFQESAGLVDAAAQAGIAVRRVADLQAEHGDLSTEQTALVQLLQQAGSSAREPGVGASAYQDLVGFPTLMKNPTVAVLLESLVAAQDRRAELLKRRQPSDDDVVAEDARIRDIEERLHGMASTYLEALTRQLASVDSELAQSSSRLDRIPSKQIRLAQLSRNSHILESVYTLFQSRLKEAELAEAADDPSVRPVDEAPPPRQPDRPRPLVNLALALLAGVSLGASTAVSRELLDRSVHTRADLLGATGLPVLSVVPHAPGLKPPRRGRIPSLVPNTMPRLIAGEAYHRLDANLMYALPDRSPQVLVVTSAAPSEGKSTCALNLAAAMTRRRQRVLLIDADLRRGTLSRLCRVAGTPGLATVLATELPAREAIRVLALEGGAAIAVLPAGTAQQSARLLASARTAAVMEALRAEYDAIIVDTPPVNAVADAALVAAHSDGVILVARAGLTSAEALALATEQLRAVRAPVLGALLNDVDLRRETSYDPAYEYLRPELESVPSG